MKILHATSLTQGQRANDYNHCADGDLAVLPIGAHHGEPVDGPCGCNRALVGAVSQRGTTTAQVVESSMTEDEWLHAVAESMVIGGWAPAVDEVDEELIAAHRQLLAVVQTLPEGAVVEYRRGELMIREMPASC